MATDLGHPYWIYIIPTHSMHQWLLLQFLVLLMMDAESVKSYDARKLKHKKKLNESSMLWMLYE